MKLKFKAVTVNHFSCTGVNLSKNDIGEFDDELAQNIMSSFPSDFSVVEKDLNETFAPKANKALKKTAKFKAKSEV